MSIPKPPVDSSCPLGSGRRLDYPWPSPFGRLTPSPARSLRPDQILSPRSKRRIFPPHALAGVGYSVPFNSPARQTGLSTSLLDQRLGETANPGHFFLACSANHAPCESLHWAIRSPPGTSMGPCTSSPPFVLTAFSAASISSTVK